MRPCRAISCHGLVNNRLLKRVHVGKGLEGRKLFARACQRSNALLEGRTAHARSTHQRLLGRGRRSPGPGRGNVCADLRAADLTANTARSTRQSLLTRHGRLLAHSRAAHDIRTAQSARLACPRCRNICPQLRAANLTANAASQTAKRACARACRLLSRANAGQKLANAFLSKAHASAKALLQHLVGCRLRLERQTALRGRQL
jgi:hypothetical protein